MVLYRRARVQGGTYFFTVTLADRRSDALVAHIGVLREAFRMTRRQRPFSVDAIVILPDHLHAIWTLPPGDADFAVRWQAIKTHFTRRLQAAGVRTMQRANGEPVIWQRRYWEHLIRDETDRARHVDYIHYNPVKHSHAQRVVDWPYSSFHAYVRRGVLDVDWGGEVTVDGTDFGERSP